MITVWGQREDTSAPPEQRVTRDYPRRREMAISDALKWLVADELAFGGRVTSLTECNGIPQLETQVAVFYKIDTVWFEGSEADMAPLIKVAAHHWRLRPPRVPLTRRVWERFFEAGSARSHLFDSRHGPAGTALLAAIGADEELARALSSHSIADICAAWELNGFRSEGMLCLL